MCSNESGMSNTALAIARTSTLTTTAATAATAVRASRSRKGAERLARDEGDGEDAGGQPVRALAPRPAPTVPAVAGAHATPPPAVPAVGGAGVDLPGLLHHVRDGSRPARI